MQAKVARLLNVGGFIAPVLWVAAFLYSGSLRPEYSHYRQYVSELAARGTPTQHFMQVTGFVIPGLLIAGFGYFLGMPAREWLVAVCRVFSDRERHCQSSGRCVSPGSLLHIGTAVRRTGDSQRCRWCVLLHARHGCADVDRRGAADVGLFQRVSFGILNLWIFVFAALIWSRPAASAIGPDGSIR